MEHNTGDKDIPGNGYQFAKHLLSLQKIEGVTVVESDLPSFYDPKRKIISLEKRFANINSITAITISAHEFAHVLQQNEGSSQFMVRYHLARWIEKGHLLMLLLLATSLVYSIYSHSRVAFLLSALFFVLPGLMRLALALYSLPLEWDASFVKAYPLLESGGYLSKTALPKSKKILKLSFYSYIAAALSEFFNLFRYRQFK